MTKDFSVPVALVGIAEQTRLDHQVFRDREAIQDQARRSIDVQPARHSNWPGPQMYSNCRPPQRADLPRERGQSIPASEERPAVGRPADAGARNVVGCLCAEFRCLGRMGGTDRKLLMPFQLRAGAKTVIRAGSRRLGYELVPFASGLAALQKKILFDRDILAVDVGANVGQYAERLRDLGFSGSILSFEPNPSAFNALALRGRRDGNWSARQVALSDVRGFQTLNVSANSVSSSLLTVLEEHLLAEPDVRTVGTAEVTVSTLDDELETERNKWLWLKLDVQGNELAVLKGGNQTLRRTLGIQAELSFGDLYESQAHWLEVCLFLNARGFLLRQIAPGFEHPVTGVLQQADAIWVQKSWIPS